MTAVYLLVAVQFSPAFFLGALGALLLVSRPRSPREWLWIALSAGALAAWLQLPDTLTNITIRAAAAFFVGTFVALSIARLQSLFARSMIALAVAVLAVAAWYLAFHLRFATLENEIITQGWAALRGYMPDLPAAMPPGADLFSETVATDRARYMAAIVASSAAVFPATLSVTALLGTRLAWSWYHRITRSPILPPAKPFAEFRFNDQLVWLLLASIATLLIMLGRPETATTRPAMLAAANAGIVLVVLYIGRGAAVLRTSLLRASPMFVGILVLMMLALFTVIPVALALLGIADTWVDFRRRMAPPSGVPS